MKRREFFISFISWVVGGFFISCERKKPLSFCKEPEDFYEKVLIAFIDTLIPGRETDPAGEPGAIDACALNLFYDPFYPVQPLIPLVVRQLEAISKKLYGKGFVELKYEERVRVVEELEMSNNEVPNFELKIFLILSSLAFYGGIYSDLGLRYCGFPGETHGYMEDFSFGIQFEEMTEDGNLP